MKEKIPLIYVLGAIILAWYVGTMQSVTATDKPAA